MNEKAVIISILLGTTFGTIFIIGTIIASCKKINIKKSIPIGLILIPILFLTIMFAVNTINATLNINLECHRPCHNFIDCESLLGCDDRELQKANQNALYFIITMIIGHLVMFHWWRILILKNKVNFHKNIKRVFVILSILLGIILLSVFIFQYLT